MKIHTAPHDLPITGGYGSNGRGEITVYCGRCKDSFAGTERWAARYLDSISRPLDREVDRGEMGPAKRDRVVASYERAFRRAGLLSDADADPSS